MSIHGLTPEQCVESTVAAWKAWVFDKTVKLECWVGIDWCDFKRPSDDSGEFFFIGLMTNPVRIKPEPKLRPYTMDEFNELVHRNRVMLLLDNTPCGVTRGVNSSGTLHIDNCAYALSNLPNNTKISINGGDWEPAGVVE